MTADGGAAGAASGGAGPVGGASAVSEVGAVAGVGGEASPAAGHRIGDRVLLRVDRDRCMGSGMCAITAPGSLTLGPDGLARPLHPGADASPGGDGPGDGGPSDDGSGDDGRRGAHQELTPDLAEAVDLCPVEALTLRPAGN
ncbi:ferredoxin [Kitasatospora sp. NPDC004240]